MLDLVGSNTPNQIVTAPGKPGESHAGSFGITPVARILPKVERRKDEDIADVLEFKCRSSNDPECLAWLAEHKASEGSKIRFARATLVSG